MSKLQIRYPSEYYLLSFMGIAIAVSCLIWGDENNNNLFLIAAIIVGVGWTVIAGVQTMLSLALQRIEATHRLMTNLLTELVNRRGE